MLCVISISRAASPCSKMDAAGHVIRVIVMSFQTCIIKIACLKKDNFAFLGCKKATYLHMFRGPDDGIHCRYTTYTYQCTHRCKHGTAVDRIHEETGSTSVNSSPRKTIVDFN